ncbi:MAG: TIGR03087 family PEP-CTERM/XrtA system glycosyltransferase [Betaproteobacteria bacterium]|nr:TIGR03087 family PEP-CTERM/XrtA system glycosyltransferase [Betaproteobacteria bacterium]
MKDLLFLAHRIPYPPDKGDKIRSWHMLRHLAQNWRVHLGAFVDDPADWRHEEFLRGVCADVCLRPLNPRRGKLQSLSGLLTGEALSLPYYRDAGLAAWVAGKLASPSGVGHAVCFSSVMAQYLERARGRVRVMDFVDIDSDKWTQYAPTKPWPLSWLYRREGRRLLDWERRVASEFDASLFVSPAEAADFQRLAPESAARISPLNNGVDADYFSPANAYPNPYPAQKRVIAFTGAMDYWPNVDAVRGFAREVMPALRERHADTLFYIVGSRPGPEVMALASDAVRVTGRVEDVRPYLAHAEAVVAPLRIARGIQNKVLEGMAMARTVIASPQALEGIAARDGEEVLRAEGVADYLEAHTRIRAGLDLGGAARARVLADYSWPAALAPLDRLLATEARA